MTLVAAETSAACLCACIPITRPFFTKAGKIASRSLNTSSLRALVSRTYLSSRASQGDKLDTSSHDSNKKDIIYRTVDIDMDSIPLRKTSSVEQELDRANILGYAESNNSPATARAWT
jgi:hypothetical protein